jgi:hypothetical protein
MHFLVHFSINIPLSIRIRIVDNLVVVLSGAAALACRGGTFSILISSGCNTRDGWGLES